MHGADVYTMSQDYLVVVHDHGNTEASKMGASFPGRNSNNAPTE